MVIDKLKGHKSSGIDEIPGELFTARGIKILTEINKFIKPMFNK